METNRILGLTLPLQRGNRGFFNTTTNILEQIKTNLTNLLLTRKGERVMQPEYGSELYKVIFEPMTDDGLSNIRASIESATQTWLPFVIINDVAIERNEDTHEIVVGISFSVNINSSMTDSILLVF